MGSWKVSPPPLHSVPSAVPTLSLLAVLSAGSLNSATLARLDLSGAAPGLVVGLLVHPTGPWVEFEYDKADLADTVGVPVHARTFVCVMCMHVVFVDVCEGVAYLQVGSSYPITNRMIS